MEVIMFESAAFEAFKRELRGFVKDAVKELLKEMEENEQIDWIPPPEAKKLLPFKSKTSWQKLRDNGEIKFSQFGRKILYSRKSIHEYLNKNKI
jgi:hypothetical protein